jgi:mannitol/fructose-specific phosphotransferase system IIA component (Ntr-type)
MRLAAAIDLALILDDSEATDRDQAIDAILERMESLALVPSSLLTEVRTSIIRRDELGPTGIGEGVAIPHASHPGLERLVAALAISRAGLDYPSIDRAPVHIVLLILTPLDRNIEPAKQQLFNSWLRKLLEPTFRASLRMAATDDDLWNALRVWDEHES